MRIAALMETFPAWSETYILWHISELVRAGESLTILPAAAGSTEVMHPEVSELSLLAKSYVARHSPSDLKGVLCASVRALSHHPWCTARLALEAACATDRRGWTLGLNHLAIERRVPRQFDVLHAYFGPSGRRAATLRAMGALRGPLVTSFLGFDANVLGARYGGSYYRDLFRRAERIGVSSEFMRGKLLGLGAPADRMIKLPLGLPIQRFPFRSKPYQGGAVRLISVGRLSEVKGIEWGLRGVALAHARGLPVELEIVGDGPLMASLRGLASELGVGERVRFHGAQTSDAVRRLVSDADVALYTGVRGADGAEEALGGSVLEAQAMGLPVIASDVGGVSEGLVPGRSGLVVPQRSPEAVAGAIGALLDRAPEWAGMGEVGRAHIEENFDSGRLHPRWIALYRELA